MQKFIKNYNFGLLSIHFWVQFLFPGLSKVEVYNVSFNCLKFCKTQVIFSCKNKNKYSTETLFLNIISGKKNITI